ncbi:MAG: MFS transporter [Pseudonocardiaceae bacterium]|nr:MFS transporter [Pseudonocardiaceae bacterium]
MAVLCTGTLMIIVDQTIVGVALPAIRADLGFSELGLAWVVNAYVIPFGGLLLLAGRLGDLVGRKRMFAWGMVVFTAASLVCGRALGVFSFVQAAGGSLGSVLGGVITQTASWPWIFYVNLPIGVLTLVLALRVLADDRGIGGAADALGGALATAGLMLSVYAIVNGVLVAGVVAVVLLAAFVLREFRTAAPLLPPRVFISVAGPNAVQALLIAGMFGFLFFSVLYLRSLHYSALATGLALTPVAASIGVVSLLLSARLSGRFGERAVLLAGLALVALGLALFACAPVSFVPHILPAMLVLGVGFGAAMPALMALGMARATESDAGMVSGLFNTSQQVGGALGLSVLVAVSTAVGGYQVAFAVAAGLVTLSALTAVLTLNRS